MKVRLDINLKIANGDVIPAGTVFSDPIPDFIMNKVPKKATIIERNPAPVEEVKKAKKREEAAEDAFGATDANTTGGEGNTRIEKTEMGATDVKGRTKLKKK